jgi:hypothetical protein
MLRDLRVKLRTRHSRIGSCGYQEFLPLSKQFFAFLGSNPILQSVVSELIARNKESVTLAQTSDPNSQVYGETDEEAATVGYAKWQSYAAQNNGNAFYTHAFSGNLDEGLNKYRDWYVEPLFDYLDEVLEENNVVLSTLTRYKRKVEWYRRDELLAVYEGDTSRGESHLSRRMYEFLFDQGLPFHGEPVSASGRPDVVSLEDSAHPFIGEIKIFDPERSKGAAYIKKGFYQAYRYCWDHNETVGHVIIFNVSDRQLRFDLPSAPGGVPRFEYNHKTIFVTVIDVHERDGTASSLGIAKTVTITEEELVQEVSAEASEATKG